MTSWSAPRLKHYMLRSSQDLIQLGLSITRNPSLSPTSISLTHTLPLLPKPDSPKTMLKRWRNNDSSSQGNGLVLPRSSTLNAVTWKDSTMQQCRLSWVTQRVTFSICAFVPLPFPPPPPFSPCLLSLSLYPSPLLTSDSISNVFPVAANKSYGLYSPPVSSCLPPSSILLPPPCFSLKQWCIWPQASFQVRVWNYFINENKNPQTRTGNSLFSIYGFNLKLIGFKISVMKYHRQGDLLPDRSGS